MNGGPKGGRSFGTATQAETREDRLAVATEYNDATLADMDIAALITQMWEPLVNQIKPDATDEQRQEIQALYMDNFEDPMIEFMRAQPEIMADIFTLEELEALRDFYATPAGRASITKLPQVLQAIQPQIMTMVQQKMPVVIPQVQQILELP